jgi:hypothetical protein
MRRVEGQRRDCLGRFFRTCSRLPILLAYNMIIDALDYVFQQCAIVSIVSTCTER